MRIVSSRAIRNDGVVGSSPPSGTTLFTPPEREATGENLFPKLGRKNRPKYMIAPAQRASQPPSTTSNCP